MDWGRRDIIWESLENAANRNGTLISGDTSNLYYGISFRSSKHAIIYKEKHKSYSEFMIKEDLNVPFNELCLEAKTRMIEMLDTLNGSNTCESCLA